ncbi:MAG: molybdopterin-dependent oxidoreductase [Fidelibacterota bacterium]
MPWVKIDDKEVEVESGTMALEAARGAGIDIPHYCYHPTLEIVGSCRMCLVEIEGMSRLQTSCSTPVHEVPEENRIDGKYDMVMLTQTDTVKKERENILEFLLINHPLDCPVCDQAGECYLQDYSFRFGRSHSRFQEVKRVRPNENLGSSIVLNHNRCIMCTRCVRFTREITGTGELFVESRGYDTKISVLEGKPLDNLLAGNVADICPVGALLSTDYVHKNRLWNLTRQSSVCTDCSVGCNIHVFHDGKQVFRISPRENHDVNGFYMCDIGRYGFHRYEGIERVRSPLIRSDERFQEIGWEGGLKEIFHRFTRGKNGEKPRVAGVVSPFHTNEANFLLGQFIHTVLKGRGILGMLSPFGEQEDILFPSGFRISGDRSPNRQGVLDLSSGLDGDFLAAVKKTKTKLMYLLDDGVDREPDDSWTEVLGNLDFLVVQTYAMTPIARLAHVILPGPAPFEREGTMTNDRGRIQWLRPSLRPEGKVRADWEILMEVMNTVGKRQYDFTDLGEILRAMGEAFPAYKGVSLFRIGDQGLPTNEEAGEA